MHLFNPAAPSSPPWQARKLLQEEPPAATAAEAVPAAVPAAAVLEAGDGNTPAAASATASQQALPQQQDAAAPSSPSPVVDAPAANSTITSSSNTTAVTAITSSTPASRGVNATGALAQLEGEVVREERRHGKPQTIAAAVIGSVILAAIVGGGEQECGACIAAGWQVGRRQPLLSHALLHAWPTPSCLADPPPLDNRHQSAGCSAAASGSAAAGRLARTAPARARTPARRGSLPTAPTSSDGGALLPSASCASPAIHNPLSKMI